MATHLEMIVANLTSCSRQVADVAVNWDESYARMAAMSLSFSRRSPPAFGVFADDTTTLVRSAAVDARLHEICYDLKEIYSAMGLATGALDDRQARLEVAPPSPPEKFISEADFADGMSLLVRRFQESGVDAAGGAHSQAPVDDAMACPPGQCV